MGIRGGWEYGWEIHNSLPRRLMRIAPGDDHAPGPARLCVLVLLLGRSVILGWVGAPNV